MKFRRDNTKIIRGKHDEYTFVGHLNLISRYHCTEESEYDIKYNIKRRMQICSCSFHKIP